MRNGNQSSENLGRSDVDAPAIGLVDPRLATPEIIDMVLDLDGDLGVGFGTEAPAERVVVFAESWDVGPRNRSHLSGHQIAARCSAMTDAIKRVDGPLVRETIDRNQLRVVDFPVIVPVGLARRWAEQKRAEHQQGAASQKHDRVSGGVFGVAELLSELSLIEPDLVVLDLEESDL